jgi:hypothetical protein
LVHIPTIEIIFYGLQSVALTEIAVDLHDTTVLQGKRRQMPPFTVATGVPFVDHIGSQVALVGSHVSGERGRRDGATHDVRV